MSNPEHGPSASPWPQMLLPDEGDNENLQAYLSEGIAAIHRDHDFQLPPNAELMSFSTVYEPLYVSQVMHLMVPAKNIYQDLADFLAEHLQVVAQKLQSVEENLLLETYLAEWDHYAAAATHIDRLLNLVNRHWVKRSIDEGKGDIYRIRTLHFLQWRVYVWRGISESVIDSAQYMMQRHDNKAAIVQDVLERFVSLRVDDSPTSPSSNSRGGIRARLEAPFVPEIEAHDQNIQQIITAQFYRY
ncbi:hypothetical protein FGRMN_6488 [Fusarium graminum]|nr:hypothetical protein FGRMN_6488 [Fusarium graminum]